MYRRGVEKLKKFNDFIILLMCADFDEGTNQWFFNVIF